MLRRLFCSVLLIAAYSPLIAQSGKTIIVRVVDGRTGLAVTPDNLQVRIKGHESINANWVKQKDDGTTVVAIPDGATAISLHATYDNSMAYYINCDVARQKDTSSEDWYPVADILSGGIKMPNECAKSKDADKLNGVEVKPGEFVLFVRKMNWKEAGVN
jgi:hypothetical protein